MRNLRDQFLEAIQRGEVNSVRELIASGIPDNAAELLHYASKSGNVAVVGELLKAGWKEFIDEFDDMSMTPLMWAAVKNRLLVAELLIASGANVNIFEKNEAGNTAIREAANSSTPEMVILLLRAGADPRIRGWMQLNAVDVAEERVRKENSVDSKTILKLLKEAVVIPPL